MALETTKTIKKKLTRLLLAFLAVAFVVPFITYDTGVRCVTHPCMESAARGGLIEFFAKAHSLNAYIVNIWLFLASFVGLYILIELLNKWAER